MHKHSNSEEQVQCAMVMQLQRWLYLHHELSTLHSFAWHGIEGTQVGKSTDTLVGHMMHMSKRQDNSPTLMRSIATLCVGQNVTGLTAALPQLYLDESIDANQAQQH